MSFVTLLSTITAQVQEQWIAGYNGTGNFNDNAYAMAVDAAGNVYVTGTTSTGSGPDIALIKYNPAGSQVWLQTFNGGILDAAFAISLDNSGNVYLTGTSEGNFITIKYNSSGALQWFQSYDGPASEEDAASSIAVDNAGNVYVAGYSTGINTSTDYTTIKYSSSGAEQWVQRYNSTGDAQDEAASLALDGTGNIYVTGGSNNDFITIKYNPSGMQEWIQAYNGPGNGSDDAIKIKIDASNNAYILGTSMGSGTNFDFALIKYNSSGVQQWVQRYNGHANNYDYPSSLVIDVSGNIYVTGNSFDDFVTVKYNSSGALQWAQLYNGPGNAGDYAYSLAVDNSANVYVTGYSFGTGVSVYDFATVKYNSSGSQQWVQRYDGPGDFYDIPFTVAVDGSGNVYVSGESGGNGSGFDFAIIKYSQTVEIEPISSEIPREYKLFQNYPNPFNPVTKIKFDIPQLTEQSNMFTKIRIYDVIGRVVQTILEENLQPGEYEITFDGKTLSSGVYYYNIEAGDYRDTKKMVLVK